MLSKKMEKALNDQVVAETFSAYLYWSMSAYFEELNLKGFASWMRVQVQEEMTHAAKFFDYIVERGGRVKLGAIEAPTTDWANPLACFKAVLKHEVKVTGLINKLVKLAREENDNASEFCLQWFVTEQVEEESSADAVIKQLELVEGAPQGLFMIDRELGQRVFTPPAGEADA